MSGPLPNVDPAQQLARQYMHFGTSNASTFVPVKQVIYAHTPGTLRRDSAVIADLVAFRLDGHASSTQTPKAGVDVAVAVGAMLKLRHTFVQDVQYESDPPEQGIRYWPSAGAQRQYLYCFTSKASKLSTRTRPGRASTARCAKAERVLACAEVLFVIESIACSA